MSTRRAVRVARATRTTRRTVEQQQLQYQHQQLDPSGLAGVFGFGPTSSSGGGGGDAYSASAPSGGALLGDGSTGLDDSGRYSKRPLIRGKPTRRWIQVRRPPAPGIGFNISVWVPVDQLTEAETSTYLPPSTNDEAALRTDAMVVELPLDTSLALPPPADVKRVSVVASIDVSAPTTFNADPDNSAAPPGSLQQGLSDKVADGAASHANDAVPSATTSSEDMTATAETGVEDALLSPNDRPTKRARFAEDENEPSAVTALGKQSDSISMEASATERQEDEADEATNMASLAPAAVGAASEPLPLSGDAPANQALLPPQPAPAPASVAPVVLPVTDSVSGRKRDLLDSEPPMGDGGDDEGPPPKRPRPSAEEGDDFPGSGVAARAKEIDAEASAGAARADTDAEMTDATTPTTVAVMEHHQPPAIKDEHSSARVGDFVADVDGQRLGPVSNPSLPQAPVGDSKSENDYIGST